MKFLLAVSAVIAMAVAQPGLVTPGLAGPAPAPLPAPIFRPPIIAGPAIGDITSPVNISPALINFPLSESGELINSPDVVAPAPAVTASSAPLVQIILNINQAAEETSPVSPLPYVPAPVRPEPVAVLPIVPIDVVDAAPAPVEPVIVGTPIITVPAINLPDILN